MAVSDTIYITKIEYEIQSRIDSIYIDRFRDRYLSGDTVYIVDNKVEYRYRYSTDTINTIDTIYVSNVDLREKIVEKKTYPLLPWEIIGAIAIGLVIAIRSKEKSATD